MKYSRWIAVAAILGAHLNPASVRADDAAETIRQLQQHIEALEQKIKTLERDRELDVAVAGAKAKEAPKISLGEKGFGFASADGNFALRIKGVLQVDSRTFLNDHGIKGNDAFLLRRARPIIEGAVYRNFDFQFIPDFGGSSPQIYDAWLNYRFNPGLQLRAGKFKSPVGLEQLQADANLLFNERSLVTDLVPNRDVGFELHGDLWNDAVSYAAGIFNGVGDARNSTNTDFEDDKEFAGRLFFRPFKSSRIDALHGFGFGVGGSYAGASAASALPNTTGGTLPGYTTDGQQQFFAYNPASGAVVANGTHWRLSPQASYYYGPLGFLGEYAISDQRVSRTGAAPLVSADLQHTAWQMTASWVLTGEDASYTGVVPRNNFDPLAGGWGAWQFVARYAELDIDSAAFPHFSNPAISAHGAASWSLGLNWWLNRNIRVLASFSHTTFSGGNGVGATVTRRDENALFTRLQVAL